MIGDEVLVLMTVLVPPVQVASYPVMSVPPLSLTETVRMILPSYWFGMLIQRLKKLFSRNRYPLSLQYQVL